MCSLLLTQVWGKMYLTMTSKRCFVGVTDGKYHHIAELRDTTIDDIDVSRTFNLLTLGFFVQSLLMVLAQGFQLTGIYFSLNLVRYRFFISRANKLNLSFGLWLLASLLFYRLGTPGMICSGDFLQHHEEDPQVLRSYLVELGTFFDKYLTLIYFLAVLVVLATVYIIKEVIFFFR